MKIGKIFGKFFALGFFVFLSALAAVGVVSAATTISTDVTTGGNLYASSTANISGLSTFTGGFISQASSTVSGGNLTIGGGLLSVTGAGTSTFTGIQGTYLSLTGANTATSTASSGFNLTGGCFSINGACIGASSGASLSVANTWTALQNFTAAASTTNFTATGNVWLNGYSTTTASNGNIATQGSLTVAGGVTNTGTLTQGSGGTALTAVQFGSCTLVSVSAIATSTTYTTCTGAGTIDSTYKVVLQPMGTMPAGLIVDAASTTATAGTLSVRINNADAGANTTTGTPTLNFWAFK